MAVGQCSAEPVVAVEAAVMCAVKQHVDDHKRLVKLDSRQVFIAEAPPLEQEVRRAHPEATIIAVDYDPGASEVNQLNRIKLMLASAYDKIGMNAAVTNAKGSENTWAVDAE